MNRTNSSMSFSSNESSASADMDGTSGPFAKRRLFSPAHEFESCVHQVNFIELQTQIKEHGIACVRRSYTLLFIQRQAISRNPGTGLLKKYCLPVCPHE
jgi:hypothetical protein